MELIHSYSAKNATISILSHTSQRTKTVIKADIHCYSFLCVKSHVSSHPVQALTLLPRLSQRGTTKPSFLVFSPFIINSFSFLLFPMTTLSFELSTKPVSQIFSWTTVQAHSPSSPVSKSRLARTSFSPQTETTLRLYKGCLFTQTSLALTIETGRGWWLGQRANLSLWTMMWFPDICFQY